MVCRKLECSAQNWIALPKTELFCKKTALLCQELHWSVKSCIALSKTKLLHEAHKGQMLMETEEKLEAAILQLQLREAEMDSVAQHFDNVNQQIHDRDMELHNLRGQVAQLQQNLSESFNENQTLKETVNQQKVNHLINASNYYDINQVIQCFCNPRLP